MSESEGLIEQWERLGRWFERFEKISKGREHTMSTDYYQDEVYAFFLNCYHLKDWIKNDAKAGVKRKTVEDFVIKYRALRLCGDICNSHKHLKFNNRKPNEEPKFGKRENVLHVGTSPVTISVHYTINTKSGDVDAFALAQNCISAWQNFFAINNLNVEPILRPMTEEQRRGKSLVKIDSN